MFKKSIFIIAIILFFCGSGNVLKAQWDDGEKPPLKERIFFGGNIALQFGTITFIEVSPLAGIRLTPRFSPGISLIYNYYKENMFTTFDTHIFGGSVFSRYTLMQNMNKFIPLGINASIIAHGEYEALNLESRYFDVLGTQGNQDRFWQHNVYVGGGLGFHAGKNSMFTIFILWNLNETENSLYSNPVVRVGFVF
jgi:hypothetical protein